MEDLPTQIEVRGAKVHNLKNIDVNIPLHKFVAISGLSDPGKSSLAMGILYAEGSRRYLDALSTYMRQRIKQGSQANVTSVKHIPSALALRQRPSVPNGHRIKPSLAIAKAMSRSDDMMDKITCPVCGEVFAVPSAEDFVFNSAGACTECGGTGKVRQLDENKLIADENLTIEDGAVAS
jgi:excinuclease ABC subunit A